MTRAMLLLLMLVSAAARADTFQYVVFSDPDVAFGDPISGRLTYDDSTSLYTGLEIRDSRGLTFSGVASQFLVDHPGYSSYAILTATGDGRFNLIPEVPPRRDFGDDFSFIDELTGREWVGVAYSLTPDSYPPGFPQTPMPTPEPGTLALLGSGLLCGFAACRRRLRAW